jgi:acyl-CoA thioester hydrolase
MTDFRFTAEVPVRYRDLDPLGHVNNAVYASYMEQARTKYLQELLDTPPADVQAVIAHLELDYRQPIEGDDDVTVALATTALGESSVTMTYEIRADGAVAATGETVMVAVDDVKGAVPLPADVRSTIAEYEGLAAPVED